MAGRCWCCPPSPPPCFTDSGDGVEGRKGEGEEEGGGLGLEVDSGGALALDSGRRPFMRLSRVGGVVGWAWS